MPFLDTPVTSQSDGSLLTTVYRKPTHTNQYLRWDSHHAISNRYSVISTLFHSAKDVCSTKEQLDEEHTHIQKVLTPCKYPGWAINRMKERTNALVNPKTQQKKQQGRNHLQYHQ